MWFDLKYLGIKVHGIAFKYVVTQIVTIDKHNQQQYLVLVVESGVRLTKYLSFFFLFIKGFWWTNTHVLF